MLKSPMTKTEDNKQGQSCVLTSNHSVQLVIRSAAAFDCEWRFLGGSGNSLISKHLT